jgi:hypothetical protein
VIAFQEKHFHTSHYPCAHSECLAQKFVVFNSTLDLKAHMVEEHGAAMTSRDKKDARRVQADFEYEEINLPGRFPRLRRGGDGDPERELPHRPSTPPLANSSGPRPNGGRRREGFGAALTVDGNRDAGSGDTTWRPPDPDFTVSESVSFCRKLRDNGLADWVIRLGDDLTSSCDCGLWT